MTMSVEESIRKKLEKALSPQALEIVNDSDRHIGHAGHDGRGESHFTLTVVSSRFSGLGRVERHRMINGILADELRTCIHALSIKAFSPDEQKDGSG